MSAKTKYGQAQEKVRAAREEARKIMKDAFNEGALEMFGTHPEIVGFSWRQFTPYFNDGDECVFSVDGDYPSLRINEHHEMALTAGLSEELEDEGWIAGYEIETYTGADPKPSDIYLPAWGAVKVFLRSFDEDDLKAMFEDHVEVTVSFDGTKVSVEAEEYNHE